MASLLSSRTTVATAAVPLVVSHELKRPTSNDYTWSDVHLAPFQIHGFIGIRAPDRSPRFNIPEQFVHRAHATMNWRKTYARSVESLALNILLTYSSLHAPLSSISLYRPARGRGISLVQAFGEDCLCSMPPRGGCIPLESLGAWWEEHVAF